MRKGVFFFLFVLGIFVSATLSTSAQDRNSVSGFVFDESRRPVAQIYIELQDDFYSTVARTRTGGSGMYRFAGLPAGTYVVKVLNVGTDFEEQSRSVSLIPISVLAGRGTASEQVDFYLRAKKRNDAFAAPTVVFAQEVPPEAKSLYEAGLSDLSNKNDGAGLDKIKRSIEAFPDYFTALDRLGNEYIARGHYEAAYVLFTKALTVNSRSFSSTFGLGLAEFRLGQTDQALKRFKEAVKMDKGSTNAHLWLGIALHTKGEFSQSLTALLEANKLSGETVAEVHWQLARVYKDQKKFADAARELELFLKYRPDAENRAKIIEMIASLRQKA
jgi:tetratricopeptide (TPR) repeat protein